MIDIADDHMRKGRHQKALKIYQNAWSQVAGEFDATHCMATFVDCKRGDFEEAPSALGILKVTPSQMSLLATLLATAEQKCTG